MAGFSSIAQQISSPPYQSSANHAQADTEKKFIGTINGSTVSTTYMRNIFAGIDVSFSGSDVWILIFASSLLPSLVPALIRSFRLRDIDICTYY